MNKNTISKWFSMFVLMMVAGITGATAQSLTVADFTIEQGETKEIAINMAAADGQSIYGIQTDITLSEGLTLESVVAADSTMQFEKNTLLSGPTRVSLLSLAGSSIPEGAAIKLTVKASDTFEAGTIKLENSKLTTSAAGAEINVDNSIANVTKTPSVIVETATFNFADPNFREKIGTKMDDVDGWIYNETFTADGASLQVTAGSSPSRIYNDNNRGQNLVTYKEYTTLTFKAPAGKAITKIEFTAAGNSNINQLAASSGAIEGMVWTGNAEGVRFTQGGTSYLANAILTLVDKTGETSVLPAIEYTQCDNIAAFNALAAGTYAKLTLTDAEVIGKSADGYSTVWIQDATGGCWIQYTSLNSRLNEKTKINGTIYAVKRDATGNTHIKEAEATLNSELNATAIDAYTAITGTIAEVNVAANLNKVVKIAADSLVMTSASAGKLYLGETTINVSNGTDTANQALCKIAGWEKNKKLENITIMAILSASSATANQLLPISIEETAVAGEDVLPIDIQFGANYNDKKVGNYTSTWTATKDGKTWTITNFNNNNNGWDLIKCGSKSDASIASIASPAINAIVKSYVITVGKAANVNSAKLFIMNGEEEVDSTDITDRFVAGDVVVPVESQKGYSYVLTIDNKKASGNGSVEISKILLSGEVIQPVEPVHIANTAETAYTVAKAIELIDAGEALSDTVFVKGIVCKVDTFIERYKSITYWISENGTTEGQQFECYSGKGIDGAEFASINDVEVGAEVVAKGLMQKFISKGDTIYEFKQNNELVSYKAPFHAPIYIETDLTAQFNSLATTQWAGSSGQVGWAAPTVTTNSGLNVAAWEKYDGSCDWTGDIMSSSVTGLAPGTYKIELYGAAAFTFGRGFGSTAFTGDFTKDSNAAYSENDAITENTGVTLFAETAEGKVSKEIPIWYATNFNTSGIATATLENVIVGDAGTIKIGLSKTSTSTNWHVVQLKGVTAQVDAVELHATTLAAAQAALNAEENAIVTGDERDSLTAAITANTTVAEQTADAYKAAIKALSDATAAFTGAKAAYEDLAAAKTDIQMVNYDDRFPYASADKKAAAQATLTAEATSAADAAAKTAAIYKAYRQFAESNAMLEGIEGATNVTDSIKNPKAEDGINNWTVVKGESSGGNIDVKTNEPWTDGDDNATHKYFDGGDWGAQAWDVALQQKIALPAGKYMLTVKGRASADVALTLFAGEAETGIPALGAAGCLFDRGWNDTSVEFEIAKADSIVIGVRGVTEVVHNWMSFSDFRLYQFPAAVQPQDSVLALTLNVERYPGLGYGVTEAAVDFTEAKQFLGVEAITTDMLRIVNPNDSLISDYAPYDGWFNGEGAAETWGANTKINVKFFQAIPEGTYTVCDMNSADSIGATYSVKWALEANAKKVVYTINVKFVEKPVITLTFTDLNKKDEQTVALTSELGKCYENLTANVDVAAILAKLEVSSLNDVTVYAVQSDGSLDDNYKLGTTDGWRNAAGDWQGWGDDAYFYVKADFSKDSSQIYEAGGMDGKNTLADAENPAAYTATYAFVKTGTTDAVVLNVTLSYTVPTGINAIARDAQKSVIYNMNGQKVNKAQKGLYIINGRKVMIK